jgi:hypothetical protein
VVGLGRPHHQFISNRRDRFDLVHGREHPAACLLQLQPHCFDLIPHIARELGELGAQCIGAAMHALFPLRHLE